MSKFRVTLSRMQIGDGSRKAELIVEDDKSQTEFLRLTFTPEEFYKTFVESFASVPVEGVVNSLDLVGKKKIKERLSFEVPTGMAREDALELAKLHCPDGWKLGDNMKSRDSFKNGRGYVSIVKYVDE